MSRRKYGAYCDSDEGDEDELAGKAGRGGTAPEDIGDSDEPREDLYGGDSDSEEDGYAVPRRKKHRCCLAVVITSLVLVIVLCGGILGGAYFAWDHFLGEPTQMDLFQGLNVLSNLYKADPAVVTAPYGKEDLDGFYDRVLDALCMTVDDGYDLDLPAIVVDMLNSAGSGEETVQAALAARNDGVSPYAAVEENSRAGEEQTTGSEELDKLLNELKFNWESLRNPTAKTGEVDISGPQIAAFVNDVLQEAFVGADSLVQMQSEWNVNFADVVSLEQVIVSAPDTINDAATKLKATVKVELRSALQSVASKFTGIAAFGIKAAAAILPKEIYFSAEVEPCDAEGAAGVVVNSTSEEDMEKMLRIVDAVFSLTGSDLRTGDFLTQINATVYNAVQSVSELLPINFVSDLVNAQPIGAVISALGLQLTPLEFFEIVRYVAAPDHYMQDDDGDGQIDGFEYVEYDCNELINTLEDNFGLITKDTPDPNVQGIYIDDNNLYASITDIFSGSDAIIDNIAFGKVAANPAVTVTSTATIDYASLAAIMRSYMQSGEATGMIAEYGFELLSLGDGEKREDGSVYITVKFKFDIRKSLENASPDLFDENGLFHNIIGQLIPSAVYLTADIEISAAETGDMHTDIIFNDAKYGKTRSLLDSLCELLTGFGAGGDIVEDLSYDSVCKTLSEAITSVLAEKDENGQEAGISRFIAGYSVYGIEMDNVYSLLYALVYEDKLGEGEKAEVTKAAFADAIKHIYLYNGKEANGSLSPSDPGMTPSAFLGREYDGPSGDGFDLAAEIIGSFGETQGATIDMVDTALADVIIGREDAVAAGDPEEPNDERANFAASLGLSADVEYGEDYWIDQLVMLGKDGGAEEERIFASFESKYNDWRYVNGLEEKNFPDELLVITATLSSAALADNNAAFKLLPQYFTVTIIMDLELTEEQRNDLRSAGSIEDVVGGTDPNDGSTIPPDPKFRDVFPVAVFINDMEAKDIAAIGKVLAIDPETADLAETVFGTDINAKIRQFLLSFALHENEGDNDRVPDIGLYTVLAYGEVVVRENEGAGTGAGSGSAGADGKLEGLGMLRIDAEALIEKLFPIELQGSPKIG